jgi:hypothetical protein
MSLTPVHDERLVRNKRESVELCGKNRGPHNYMPIEMIKNNEIERVTRLMCTVCFTHVSVANLLEHSKEVSY